MAVTLNICQQHSNHPGVWGEINLAPHSVHTPLGIWLLIAPSTSSLSSPQPTYPPSSAPATPSFSSSVTVPFHKALSVCVGCFLLPAQLPPLSSWQTPTHSSKFSSRVTSSESFCTLPLAWHEHLHPLCTVSVPFSPSKLFSICLPPWQHQNSAGSCQRDSAIFFSIALG